MSKIRVLPMPGAVSAQRGGQYTYCNNLHDLFQDDLEIEYLPVSQPKGWNIPVINKFFFNWKDLYRKIKRSQCDIVHINGYLEPSTWQEFIIAKLLNKRIIYSPHFHPFKYLRRPILGKVFFYALIVPMLPFAKSILTIGESDKRFFQRLSAKVISIPHHFVRKDLIDLSSIQRNPKMILFVGRNEPNKGLDYLYELPRNYEVHCVTDGILKRKDFIQHYRISNAELSRLYATASLVVVPSMYEAFSLVALESFSHGTPVLMSSNVKIIDYLNEEEGYGVFKYGDKADFLSKIESLMGTKVQADEILSKFSPDKIKEDYKRMFFNAINRTQV